MKFYFESFINFFFSKVSLFLILLIYCILIIFFNDLEKIDLTIGDAGSYISFSYENLDLFFSQHRSFGLPLILDLYFKIFNSYDYWGYFNLFLFFISLSYLILSLYKYMFNKFFISSIFYGVLLTYGIIPMFSFINTDLVGLCFIIISICFFLEYLHGNKKLYFIFFILTLTYTILTRTSYIVFLPSFIIYLYFFKYKNFKFIQSLKKISIEATLISLPILIFIILRFITIQDIGLVSFKGTFSSHHPFMLLEKNQIELLDSKNQNLAMKFIDRRSKLSGPCNLSYEQISERDISIIRYKDLCWNDHLMSAWLIKVKEHYDKEPEVSLKNYFEPWREMNLSLFFSVKNDLIDKELKSLIVDSIKINRSKYINVVFQQAVFKGFFGFLYSIKLFILIFTAFMILTYFIYGSKKLKFSKIDKELSFFIFNLSNYIFLLFVTSVGPYPDPRYFMFQCIFLIPSLYGIFFCRLRNLHE